MKFPLQLNLILGLLFGLVACSDGDKTAGGSEDTNGVVAILDKTISGVSQKGPFVNGSSVTMQELDPVFLGQTGKSFEGKIKNDQGEFAVQVKELESPFALLKAVGFYRNEVSGERSTSQVTLYAITDLSERNLVNVNLLTHLEYERSVHLVTRDSLSLIEAKNKAKNEVLKAFGIEADDVNSEDLNLFEVGEENAALLAISVMMQSNLKEAAFSERLANFASDLEYDGVWDDSLEIVKIADWSREQSLSDGLYGIRKNIESWNVLYVPDFEKYVKVFWWNVYGLGDCSEARNGEVLQNQNGKSGYAKEYYICKNREWLLASDLEKDTYKWNAGEEGDVKAGSVEEKNCYVFENSAWRAGHEFDCSLNLRGCTALRQDTVGQGSDKIWYTCDEKNWRKSTTFEKDTYGWESAADGVIRKGNVTDTVYVFDKTGWRATSAVESKLGGCVSAIKDSVGAVNGKYYICRNNIWTEATAIEYDTYHWEKGLDGDSKAGSVNAKNCYVFEGSAWRIGNGTDCSLGLGGCTALRQHVVELDSDKIWYTCDSKTWRVSSNIEKDTVSWGAGKNGEVRVGQVNTSVYYIYEKSTNAWREATVIEKDTYDYENNVCWSAGYDGEIRMGSVSKTVYVYDVTKWRVADAVEGVLGGCVEAVKDSVGVVESVYYICNPRKWTIATALQYDTYHWNDTIDGAWRKGSVDSLNVYVFDKEDGGWRPATTVFDTLGINGCTIARQYENADNYDDINEVHHYYMCYNKKWNDGDVWSWDLPKEVYLNRKIKYGQMTDSRDNTVYKTVEIGKQIWMAENLNYADSIRTPSLNGKSWCINGKNKNCNVGGRLYTWAAAIDSVQIFNDEGIKCGYGRTCVLNMPLKGICPDDWHLPSADEWNVMFESVGSQSDGAPNLKSRFGWRENGNGIDLYGFSVFPTGNRDYYGNYPIYSGHSAYFWSSSENGTSNAVSMIFFYHVDYIESRDWNRKDYAFSIRCLKNLENEP